MVIYFIFWLHWVFVAAAFSLIVMSSWSYSLAVVGRLSIAVATHVARGSKVCRLQCLRLPGSGAQAQ